MEKGELLIIIGDLEKKNKQKERELDGICRVLHSEVLLTKKTLRDIEIKYRTVLENTKDAVFILDNKRVLECNEYALKIFRCSKEELIDASFFDVFSPPHQPSGQESKKKATLKIKAALDGEYQCFEWQHCRLNGELFFAEVILSLIETEQGKLLTAIIRDITMHKQAEDILIFHKAYFQQLFENSPEGIVLLDKKDRIIAVNKGFQEIFQYSLDDINGKYINDFIAPDDLVYEAATVSQKVQDNKYVQIETERKRRDGTRVKVLLLAIPVMVKNKQDGIIAIYKDITDEKYTEERLWAAHQQLVDVIDFLPDATFVVDTEGKVVLWNRAIEEMTGVKKIDIVGRGEYAYNVPFYGVGEPGIIAMINSDDKRIKDRYTLLERKGHIIIAEAYANALYDGEGACLWIKATPLFDREGKRIGAIESVRDITDRKKAETKLRQNNDKLRKNVESTIRAMSKIMEYRDAYTAGHQQHVAHLASRIAKEMKLTEEQVECIRIAGMVHDIGKIYIPSEILTRPSKLIEDEFRIVMTHSKVAYEILKDIEFPWPIAEIVLQHHERIDGSGYPARLTRDDILLEARVLSVADVVEAMSHHRPYRPALGTEKALEEIKCNKGILYDEVVVDACTKLFTSGNFNFKEIL